MKVLLLAGGASNERQISIASGQAVYDALNRLKHTVYVVDPATGKSLLTGEKLSTEPLPQVERTPRQAARARMRALISTLGSPGFQDIDIVFNALHGGIGENGSIQCLLDIAGVKYTGSGMTASAITMNKAMTKRVCKGIGLLTPSWMRVHLPEDDIPESMASEIDDRNQLPVIVKPNDGGSTIGLSIVRDRNEIIPALKKAHRETRDILVEEYIKGRELTVSVLDGRALPVVEIQPDSGLYDFDAKYTKGKSKYVVPAPIEEDIAKKMQAASERLFGAVDAAGLVRIDFILTPDNRFFMLEINTSPGMTELSLAPMAARAAGIEFDGLIDQIVQLGLKTEDMM